MSGERSRSYSMRIGKKGVHFEKRESTSIKIAPELWKEVKIEAIRRDLEISQLVELALRKELGKEM